MHKKIDLSCTAMLIKIYPRHFGGPNFFEGLRLKPIAGIMVTPALGNVDNTMHRNDALCYLQYPALHRVVTCVTISAFNR